jgi:phosphopantothenoylcysteine decarboxylase/phosphopantothenate--cysteine ligase
MGDSPPKPPGPASKQAPLSPSGFEELTEVTASRRLRRRLLGKKVTLCVTGSIAAYKAAVLVRLLMKEGADVSVVMTRSSEEFVGRATFSGLTGKRVHVDMFDDGVPGELHVELARESELVLVVPATADALSRFAAGRADDLTSALALCATCPVLVAPAMHPNMWAHPATQRNVQALAEDRRIGFVGPVSGEVASGESGLGRMAEPEAILAYAVAQLSPATLRGRHVVITAGPTAEDLDPVRYVSNRSSGKMGFAIAERAAAHGAKVTLIAGPVSLETPASVTRVDVRSATAMRSAIWQALRPDLSGADALIMAAAVADFRPAEVHATKLKRSGENLTLELVPNSDILAEIGAARHGDMPVLIGFALETDTDERVIANARTKLAQKRVDLVVANHADQSIGRDDIRALLVGARDCQILEPMPKEDAADQILSHVAKRLRERSR